MGLNVRAQILAFSPMNISVIIKLILMIIIKLLFPVHTMKTFLLPHAIYELVTKTRAFSVSY